MAPERLDWAANFGRALNDLVWNLEISSSARCRAAATSFGIARDHHCAMVLLFRHTFYSSGMALVRSIFEAYLRGLWLRYCATDAQIEAHFEGADPPSTMLADIERLPVFSSGVLSKVKRDNWNAMCQYTHTGGLHLKQWQTASSIEPSFPDEELECGLTLASRYSALASFEMAQLAVDGDGGVAVLEVMKKWLAE